MLRTKVLLVLLLSLPISTYGLEIINQTNTPKVLQIKEAYRPSPQGNEILAYPKPYYEEPLAVIVSANSSAEITLRTSCPLLLVTEIVTKITDGGKKTERSHLCFSPTGKTSLFAKWQGSQQLSEPSSSWFSKLFKDSINNTYTLVIYEPDSTNNNFMDTEVGYDIKLIAPKNSQAWYYLTRVGLPVIACCSLYYLFVQ